MSALSRALSGFWKSSVFLAMIALLGAVVSASAARSYLLDSTAAIRAESERRFELRPVVVARMDLRPGELLRRDTLAVRSMPAHYLPGNVFGSTQAGELIGRRLEHGIRKGEPVQATLLQNGEKPSLEELLAPGHRALTVAVDELNAHSGLLHAGDRVDLYLVRTTESGSTRLDLLMQQVLVLATGGRTAGETGNGSETSDRDFGTLTLLVDAAQAGRIVLAERMGQLSFVLRPDSDQGPTHLPVLDSTSLLPDSSRSVRPRAAVTDGVELLLGGGGGPFPRRSWIRARSFDSPTQGRM